VEQLPNGRWGLRGVGTTETFATREAAERNLRAGGGQTYNYVVFNEKDIEILGKQ
jgi:hypothetical protein